MKPNNKQPIKLKTFKCVVCKQNYVVTNKAYYNGKALCQVCWKRVKSNDKGYAGQPTARSKAFWEDLFEEQKRIDRVLSLGES